MQGAIPKPKTVSVTIVTTNRFGRKWSNVAVKLTRIDDYYYHKPEMVSGITKHNGKYVFDSIPEGCYLVSASTKKISVEEVHVVKENETIIIKLPSIFGWRKKTITVGSETLAECYKKFRTDTAMCFECKRKYKGWQNAHKCNYCEKYFCSDHWLPENHHCWGTPRASEGGRAIQALKQSLAKGEITKEELEMLKKTLKR